MRMLPFGTAAKRQAIRVLTVVLFLPILVCAKPLQGAPDQAGTHRVTPHDTLLSHLARLARSSARLAVQTIGTTVQGRDIPLVHIPPLRTGATTKVLLFCQQHGNEPSGKEAALILLKSIAAGRCDSLIGNLDLHIIPSVNPDGNESGKRVNANGADLNRDHLLLSQPEVRALHSTFTRLQPEVALDVHEYSPYRRELREAGYVLTADEQFGAPSNLNVSPALRDYSLRQLLPFLERTLTKQGIRFSNYLRIQAPDDTVRYSTTNINDGRQSLAILNTLSLILEGRNGRHLDDELDRRTRAQLAAIMAFLDFVNREHETIRSLVHAQRNTIASLTGPVVTQMDYIFEGVRIDVPVKTLSSNSDSVVSMAFAPAVKPLASVERPAAYVVPASQRAIRELLDRHAVRYDTVARAKELAVEISRVIDVAGSWMEDKRSTSVVTCQRSETVSLVPGDIIVPLNQLHGTMLVIALEPSSMWGIVQEKAFAGLVVKGSDYPVFRIPARGR